MNKKLVNFIVKKYLKFDKTNPFISISGILAFVGVAIGVMVLIIAMGIMQGTKKEFEDKLFTMNYPLTIYPKYDGAVNIQLLNNLQKKFPNLIFSPFLTTQVMVQSEFGMSGGVVFGVNPQKEKQINTIYKKATKNIKVFPKYHIILGDNIAKDLEILPNEKATLFFTSITPTGFSTIPTMKRFIYLKKFKSGLNAYDSAYIYTSLKALQTILHKPTNEYDGIHIYSSNPFDDILKIKKQLPKSVNIIGWWEQNGNFFRAMEMEKKALFLVLMLIILVASLNIISSLLMTVMSRRKEIALLLSLGTTPKEIKMIFLKLGFILGGGGIVVGIILGLSGIYILSHYDIISIPADVYGTNHLPINLTLIDFMSIVIGALIIVIISSYYPAKKATKINVIEVLRNE
jgi:putative ABC transport system permease protein